VPENRGHGSEYEGTSQDVVLATFTDPGGAKLIGDYSATIDWGDGQASLHPLLL
jgi:hypothetical protein